MEKHKHRTRSQRKRIAIRRQRRKDKVKESTRRADWEHQLVEFLGRNTEPDHSEIQKVYTKTFYEKVNNKRRRVILYTNGQDVYAHFNNHFGVIYITPDGHQLFLPNSDEPTGSIKKIAEFARQFGINEFPIHPKYRPPKPLPKPRLIKGSKDQNP
jgi:hypothetical protein